MPLFLSLRSPTEFIRLDEFILTKLHLANSIMVWRSILVENTHTQTHTNKFRIVTFMRVPNYTLAKWHSLVCSFSFVRFGVWVFVRMPCLLSIYANNFGERTVFSIHSCVSWFAFALAFLIYLFVRSNDSRHLRNIALFSVHRCWDYTIYVGWSHTNTHTQGGSLALSYNGVFHIDVTFIWLCLHYFIRFSLFSHLLVGIFVLLIFRFFLFFSIAAIRPTLVNNSSNFDALLLQLQLPDIISRGQLTRIRPSKSSNCTSEGYHKDMILTTA